MGKEYLRKMNKPRVALIEDDALLSKFLKEKLLNAGFDVLQAYDGEAGLKLIWSEKPDVVLLDVMMPERDGISVLKSLRGNVQTENIPVIMLTNLSEKKVIMKTASLGVSLYFIKSKTEIEELIGWINEIFAETRTQPPRINTNN